MYNARLNVPTAQAYVSDGWAHVPEGPYDLIISNPPIHSGKMEDHTVLDNLISESARRLSPHGQLILVGQGRLNLGKRFASQFKAPKCIQRNTRFQVWSSR